MERAAPTLVFTPAANAFISIKIGTIRVKLSSGRQTRSFLRRSAS
jgi:hypothetical protein